MRPNESADVSVMVVAGMLALLAMATLWGAREFSSMGSLFPIAIGISLLGASLIVFWRAWRGIGRKDRSLARDESVRSGVLIATMLVWIAALETVGFAVTSIVAFLVLAVAANRDPVTPRRILIYLVIAVSFVLAFHFLFVHVLKVQLPRGTIGLL